MNQGPFELQSNALPLSYASFVTLSQHIIYTFPLNPFTKYLTKKSSFILFFGFSSFILFMGFHLLSFLWVFMFYPFFWVFIFYPFYGFLCFIIGYTTLTLATVAHTKANVAHTKANVAHMSVIVVAHTKANLVAHMSVTSVHPQSFHHYSLP